MDRRWCYEIRIEDNLADHWSEWFEGLAIRIEPHGGETILSGPISDQAALFGVLNKIQALNLILISVKRFFPEDG